MHGLSQIQRQNAEAAQHEREKREGEAKLRRLIAEHHYPDVPDEHDDARL